MLLSSVREGERVRIARVEAGQDLTARLTAMGLLPKVEITVLKSDPPGPFVIQLRDSRIVIGRGMAEKIIVF